MNCKLLMAITAAGLLAGCAGKEKPFESYYALSAPEKLDRGEQHFLTKYPEQASRSGDVLSLKLGNGEVLQLQNYDYDQCQIKAKAENWPAGSERCPVQYEVLGYWKKHQMFLINIFMYYEEQNLALVYANGKSDELFQEVLFSPGGDKLVTIQSGCGYYLDAVVAVIAISRLASQPLHISSFERANAAEIYSARWDGNNRLLFEMSDCTVQHPNKTMTLQQNEQGAWVWSGPLIATEQTATQ